MNEAGPRVCPSPPGCRADRHTAGFPRVAPGSWPHRYL